MKMFKAACSTRRFRKGQVVWIVNEFAHDGGWKIKYRFRGRGRVVTGYVSSTDRAVGKMYDVDRPVRVDDR